MQVLDCIASEIKKIQPQHIRTTKSDDTAVYDSDVNRILNHPNHLMTFSDFIEKVTYQLFFNANSFIIPVFTTTENADGIESRRYTGLYPVQPQCVDFVQDASEKLFVKFRFKNNYEVTLPYQDIIHVRHQFSKSEFMGGDENGQPNNRTLLQLIDLNNSVLQGVGKALKSSFAINGIVKYNTLIDSDKMETAIADMENHLRNNESGLLGLDLKGELIPFKRDVKIIDTELAKFIDQKILRTWGVSLSVLNGEATKEEYEAFFGRCIEGLIINFSQSFTKALFTDREKGFGNKVVFRSKELVFMTNSQKLQLVRLLGDSGALFENEKRAIFGMSPLPELEGIRRMSLNYVDAELASRYQLGDLKPLDEDKNLEGENNE